MKVLVGLQKMKILFGAAEVDEFSSVKNKVVSFVQLEDMFEDTCKSIPIVSNQVDTLLDENSNTLLKPYEEHANPLHLMGVGPSNKGNEIVRLYSLSRQKECSVAEMFSFRKGLRFRTYLLGGHCFNGSLVSQQCLCHLIQ